MSDTTADDGQAVSIPAIAMFIVALVLAALNGALMKQLTDALPPVTIIWARFSVYMLVILPFALPGNGVAVFAPPQFRLQLFRVVLMLAGTWCFITGVKDLAYADAIAILYVYPFVMIALSPLLLSERVSRAAWICVCTGFVGVVIVMRPSFDVSGIPALFGLAAGIILGCHMVIGRQLVKARSPMVTSAFTAIAIAVITSAIVPFVWRPLTGEHLTLFAALGIISAVSQYLMLLAFSKSPAPVLAPFGYTEIPAAAAIGILAFAEWPDAIAWIGIAVIVMSGVIVARLSRAIPVPKTRRPLP